MKQRTFEMQIADDRLFDEIIEKTERTGAPAPHCGGDDGDGGPPDVVIKLVITGLNEDERAIEPEPAPTRRRCFWFAIGAALGLSN